MKMSWQGILGLVDLGFGVDNLVSGHYGWAVFDIGLAYFWLYAAYKEQE